MVALFGLPPPVKAAKANPAADWHGTYLDEHGIVADMVAKIEAHPVSSC